MPLDRRADRATAAPVRVLVADDDPLARMVMVGRLSGEAGVEVAGQVGDGGEVLTAAAEQCPDVVLLDLAMPDLDATTVIRRLRGSAHPPQVVVLTQFEDDDLVDAALAAGAVAQLVKSAPQDELLDLIRSVAGRDWSGRDGPG